MKSPIRQRPNHISPANNAKPRHSLLLCLSLLAGCALATCLFIGTRAAAHDSATPVATARLSEQVSMRAAGRGTPYLSLTDGREALTAYMGATDLVSALQENRVTPLSLAAADFD